MPALITELPAYAHPKVSAIHAYWQECALAAGPGLLPRRQQIDPLRIPKLLENMWLMDVVGRPPLFRLRLVGGAIKRMGMLAAPGDFIEQYMAPDAPPLREMAHVIAENQLSWFRGPAYMPHETELFLLERIFLPLAEDGRNVDVLMCLTVFFDAQGREI